MGEASIGADVGNGDAEGLTGDNGNEGAVAAFEMDGFADFPSFPGGVLSDDAGFLDEFDEWLGRAVSDGGLVGIHFDDGIVHTHAGQGGDDMLDGVYFDGAFCEGGGPFDSLHLFDIGVDEGLVGDVDAAEFEAMVFGGGFEGEGDFLSGVEGGAFKSGGFGQGVLRVG